MFRIREFGNKSKNKFKTILLFSRCYFTSDIKRHMRKMPNFHIANAKFINQKVLEGSTEFILGRKSLITFLKQQGYFKYNSWLKTDLLLDSIFKCPISTSYMWFISLFSKSVNCKSVCNSQCTSRTISLNRHSLNKSFQVNKSTS